MSAMNILLLAVSVMALTFGIYWASKLYLRSLDKKANKRDAVFKLRDSIINLEIAIDEMLLSYERPAKIAKALHELRQAYKRLTDEG